VLLIIFAKQLNGSIPCASHHRLAEAASDDGWATTVIHQFDPLNVVQSSDHTNRTPS
jgi:hypothetical protein